MSNDTTEHGASTESTESSETTESTAASANASRDHTRDGESMLSIRGLDAGYGDLQILTDVDLDVADGEYVTIVGPNGAGKSTVMKTIFGLTTHMDGEIEFDGDPIQADPPEEIIHKGIGFVPQTDNVFPGLSVRENLDMGAYILDGIPEDRIEAIYDQVRKDFLGG